MLSRSVGYDLVLSSKANDLSTDLFEFEWLTRFMIGNGKLQELPETLLGGFHIN